MYGAVLGGAAKVFSARAEVNRRPPWTPHHVQRLLRTRGGQPMMSGTL